MKGDHQTDLSVLGVPILCGTASQLPELVLGKGYSAVFVLCDTHTHTSCWPRLVSLPWKQRPSTIVVEAGEQAKSLDTCQVVWDALVAGQADRHSLVINLGGGVVTDLGGFCAATYMRGIDFIHVPTTILAMTDAAVGGKHGVDFRNFKNYIGLFVQPRAIVVDTAFLNTLPPRQLRNGLAEVIKHGLIGDMGILQTLESNAPHSLQWQELVAQSILVKKRFVERDPLETGLRAALNFGHTVGHAIESAWIASGADGLHGEAIALGMQVELELSHTTQGLPAAEVARARGLIDKYLPGLTFPRLTPAEVIERMGKDKKNVGGDIRFALLKNIEQPVTGCVLTREKLISVLSRFFKG